jgi:hypothetical protein
LWREKSNDRKGYKPPLCYHSSKAAKGSIASKMMDETNINELMESTNIEYEIEEIRERRNAFTEHTAHQLTPKQHENALKLPQNLPTLDIENAKNFEVVTTSSTFQLGDSVTTKPENAYTICFTPPKATNSPNIKKRRQSLRAAYLSPQRPSPKVPIARLETTTSTRLQSPMKRRAIDPEEEVEYEENEMPHVVGFTVGGEKIEVLPISIPLFKSIEGEEEEEDEEDALDGEDEEDEDDFKDENDDHLEEEEVEGEEEVEIEVEVGVEVSDDQKEEMVEKVKEIGIFRTSGEQKPFRPVISYDQTINISPPSKKNSASSNHHHNKRKLSKSFAQRANSMKLLLSKPLSTSITTITSLPQSKRNHKKNGDEADKVSLSSPSSEDIPTKLSDTTTIYASLLSMILVHKSELKLVEALCSTCPPAKYEELADELLAFFNAHHSTTNFCSEKLVNCLLKLEINNVISLNSVCDGDIDSSSSSNSSISTIDEQFNTLFRGSSIAAKVFSSFMRKSSTDFITFLLNSILTILSPISSQLEVHFHSIFISLRNDALIIIINNNN